MKTTNSCLGHHDNKSPERQQLKLQRESVKLLLSHIFIVGRRFSVHPQKRSTGVNLRHRPLVLHDLHCTVQRAFVLVSFETLSERTHTGHKPCQQLGPGRPGDSTHLHSGLDDIQGSVSEHAGSASDGSEHTGYHGVNGFVGVIPLVIHKKKSFWSSSWITSVLLQVYTHLCTSSSARSWRKSGWPGWSLVSTLWPSDPDKSPSVLRIHQ